MSQSNKTQKLALWFIVAGLSFSLGYYTRFALNQEQPLPTKPSFAFVAGGSNAFWEMATAGARKAAMNYDVEVEVHIPTGGLAEQTQILSSLPIQRLNGVSVSPMDPEEQSTILGRIADKIDLITHDSDAPNSGRLCYVGTNNLAAGKLCAQLVREAIPEGGTVAVFVGSLQKHNAQMRYLGFVEELLDIRIDVDSAALEQELSQPRESEKFTLLPIYLDGQDSSKAKANGLEAIADNKNLDCMVGLFASNGPMCLKAIEESNKVGEIKIVAFDTHEETIKGIEEGSIYGTILQNPFDYGFESIRILVDYQEREPYELPIAGGGSVSLPCDRLTKENLKDYKEKLAEQLAVAENGQKRTK